jgi:hypothetical protein
MKQMEPIPGKGITPEAAIALGLPESDPRIVVVTDGETDDNNQDISDPFPELASMVADVPLELSSGDSIPDEGIGNEERDEVDAPPAPTSSRKRVSRVKKTPEDEKEEPRDPSARPPSLDEWMGFFSRIVLKTSCDWYLSYAFRGVDEDLLTEREIERLSMTADERKTIATPLAELSNKSKFMRKHGRTIVASGDAFNAMVIIGAWMARVNRIAARYKPKNAKGRVVYNGSSGPGTTPENDSGIQFTTGTSNGRIPNGFPVYGPGTG